MKEFKQVGARDGSVCPLPKYRASDGMHIAELDNCYCPSCGNGPLIGATGINHNVGEKPVPTDGCPTICIFCTELCVFRKKDDNLVVEIAPEREREVWRSDKELWTLLKKVQKVMERKATERQLKGDKNFAKFKPKKY